MSQYPQKNSISVLDLVWQYKFLLFFYVICISTVTFAVLYAVGGVPNELRVLDPAPISTATSTRTTAPQAYVVSTIVPKTSTTTSANNQKGELPRRVIIEKISVNAVINTPPGTTETVLNDYLTRGVVRYPDSGTLGYGNTLLFGHSSSLKVINNPAYKIFTRVRELNLNDRIRVQSVGKEYVYKVTSLRVADSDEIFVDLNTTKNMITLATCNVFGQKEERFIVEAEFVSSRAI
jgi:LPXTG-site transpeptidase (sortase) family protein